MILEFFKPARPFTKFFANTYGRHVMPALGKWISKDNQAYDYLHRSIQGFYTLLQFENILEKVGFEIIESKDLTGGITSMVLANALHDN